MIRQLLPKYVNIVILCVFLFWAQLWVSEGFGHSTANKWQGGKECKLIAANITNMNIF